MKQDDLTEIKHVGLTRMRLLNDLGITTIKQLLEMPLEKLAETKSIGAYYAKLIKNSVNEYYKEKKKKLPAGTVSAKEKKINQINRDLQKKVKRLNKNLNRASELLKPLWEKKYLELYIEFKKRSTKLESSLEALGKIQQGLPKKAKKNIIKKADVLILNLKKVGKKPKKK
ncbi:MAG: hypothetical protein KKH68_11775, partial [Proteobacteria bacterium]|nr:hypothetical protein [Pseudomonadota bacterium]